MCVYVYICICTHMSICVCMPLPVCCWGKTKTCRHESHVCALPLSHTLALDKYFLCWFTISLLIAHWIPKAQVQDSLHQLCDFGLVHYLPHFQNIYENGIQACFSSLCSPLTICLAGFSLSLCFAFSILENPVLSLEYVFPFFWSF